MKTLLISITLAFLVCTYGYAQSITYEIYKIDNDSRTLLFSGTKKYNEKDIIVTPEYRKGLLYGTRKELELSNGFTVGYLDTYNEKLTDFGIWVSQIPYKDHENDFSWEWFKKVGGNNFAKHQGGAKVKVNTFNHSNVQELVQIDFNDDVDLDYKENICCNKNAQPPCHYKIR